jgi:phosphoesterase RecJ-like protein
VTAKTLSLGAEMLAPGIDAYEISRPLYEEYPVSRLHLENLVLTRLDSHFSGQLMLSWLVYEDFVRLGAAISESENLVNKLRQCRGVRIGILITVGPKITRVSLRGKDVNVADIASKFGGGGHRFAAGLKTSIALDDLKRALIIEAGKALNPSGEPIA